ncbi:MAG: diacylglycerol kinase family protein [Novosphingobium sp.]
MHGTIYEFEQLPRVVHHPVVARVRSPRAYARPAGAGPLVGIVRNPRSHRNRGHEPEMADRPNILTATPRTRAELRQVLAEFAQRGIEYLAVDGGDGTVRDVLTSGAGIFANRWPRIIVLPKGKTNALAVDLGLPNVWSLAEALDAVHGGRTIERRPLTVELPDGEAPRLVHGFILGAGVFTLCTQAGQKAHRWGAFNSFAVALAILFGLLQALFGGGRNRWRSGTRMRLHDTESGNELTHSGRGERDRRFLLFASTLERFPLGFKPFGKLGSGLKLGLIDAPLRRLLLLLPLVFTGRTPRAFTRAGGHLLAAEAIELDLEDRFILDGEYFPAGRYRLRQGPRLRFVVP